MNAEATLGDGVLVLVAEANDGDDPNSLAGLERRQERYVVGVRVDFYVGYQRRVTSPVQRAGRVLQAPPRWHWQTVRWRNRRF